MSQLYVDIKYGKIVSGRIARFKMKRESPFWGAGRCPVCGDSSKNPNKTRFHMRQHDDTIFLKCFNCDYSANLLSFLKTYHSDIYSDYAFERYRNLDTSPIITSTEVIKSTPQETKTFSLGLVSELDLNHPVRAYVASRKLPAYPFMYAEKFFEFSSQFNPDFKQYGTDEPRLVIPFFDKSGEVYAYQGRDLTGKSNQKYITVIVNKKTPKIFGIAQCNFKKPVKIVEGPIDSLFLPNCIASVNASLLVTASKIEPYINKSLITIVYDNEPRNKNIVKMYSDAIRLGYNTVIWPKEVNGIKDINLMVLNGIDPCKVIEKNTYSGLSGQLELQKWKRC